MSQNFTKFLNCFLMLHHHLHSLVCSEILLHHHDLSLSLSGHQQVPSQLCSPFLTMAEAVGGAAGAVGAQPFAGLASTSAWWP